MNSAAMKEVMTQTQAGDMTFPEVVRHLLEANVESYFCDLASGQNTFYLADGETHTETMTLPLASIAADFSPAEVIAAIRGAQSDILRYPQFIRATAAAGVIGYWAFLTGRKVIYFGRKGESHTEHFPGTRL